MLNFRADLNENKRGLGMFVGKVRTIIRPGTSALLFVGAFYMQCSDRNFSFMTCCKLSDE